MSSVNPFKFWFGFKQERLLRNIEAKKALIKKIERDSMMRVIELRGQIDIAEAQRDYLLGVSPL